MFKVPSPFNYSLSLRVPSKLAPLGKEYLLSPTLEGLDSLYSYMISSVSASFPYLTKPATSKYSSFSLTKWMNSKKVKKPKPELTFFKMKSTYDSLILHTLA